MFYIMINLGFAKVTSYRLCVSTTNVVLKMFIFIEFNLQIAKADIPKEAYKKKYPQIVGFHYVSSSTMAVCFTLIYLCRLIINKNPIMLLLF